MKKTVALRIPVDNAGKAYDRIQQVADIEEEQWGNEYFTARLTPLPEFSLNWSMNFRT